MESIYTLLSAMKGQQRSMDAISNNLANVNTTGYKGDKVLFREYYNEMAGQDLESEEEKFAHDEFISPLSRGGSSFVMPDHVSPSMAKGTFKATERPFDLAIRSEGFFVVETPYGTRYTRNGQFLRDPKGLLTTNSGDKVQGLKGDILVNGQDFSVGEDGSILVDGRTVDTLKIMGFSEENRLTKLGNSYWAPSSSEQKPVKPQFISIEQRVLESSNVDTVQEMVSMINVNRSYEASQKLMRSLDDLDEQVISIAKI
ncbi:MAG: flagellar basal-body rod protein FlgF [Deltaproteobacteria bacterium]|nr:flagellar basal-body rod protein FlgF [Deltaproteobacteria bacterium]MBT4638609.1 flagellar basal-body rod protein FlgF [Deltaproteobacteria bacterium]MBT6503528.1 flagellar basal-body rod protein FlgF [Deltaproteobacteria bacterium]MBT7152283.1 flagellar basal-body rod protein FlgF [Deltaproteobacteria bacterium]MBT7714885.1 flagellar basal-body rod protein FlgF [Deltaproteobacteria bacterium]